VSNFIADVMMYCCISLWIL